MSIADVEYHSVKDRALAKVMSYIQYEYPTLAVEVKEALEAPDIGYSFNIAEVGDVRHMLISASEVASHPIPEDVDNSYVRTVLLAQADMVTKGLHLRNLDDVPDFLGDVSKFHQKFGQEYLGKPRMLPADLHDFRCKFHAEEADEYRDEYESLTNAVLRQDDRDIVNSLELQLDALVDGVWVLLGTADLQFGRDAFNQAWKRVMDANMSKVRADADPDALDSGREAKYDIRKPAGWVAPDHRDLVRDHAHKLYRQPGEINPGHTIEG